MSACFFHRAPLLKVRPVVRALGVWGLVGMLVGTSQAQTPITALASFSNAAGNGPPAPWRYVGLPGDKVAKAQMDLVSMGNQKVLRMQAHNAYGTWVHAWNGPLSQLRWRWRLDQAPAAANLLSKEGDDVPLKVCVSFDTPLADLPFAERTKLSLARAISGEKLPAATLCYVWDQTLVQGQVIANAYTQRVRFMVLNVGSEQLGQWQSHDRDVGADFLKAFGHESKTIPPAVAVVVGADTDNTHGNSVGYVGDVRATP